MKKKDELRTAGFVCFGILTCLAAALTHFLTQPDTSKDFELVGQPFFEEFTSATQAKSLEVAALDPEGAGLKQFSVAERDGLWRIPSHYDYPAEAADRLATTATSVMGIERESLVGRLESDHERFGVVDPLGDEARDPESTGKRITIRDKDSEALVDFIVGKEAGDVVIPMAERAIQDAATQKYYYIRRPDEPQTYKVRLNVDISTRFADWIDPDLLKLNKSDLRTIDIDNYELQEQSVGGRQQVFKVPGDKLNFSRADGMGSWELDGLKEETEELEISRINEITNVLDQMKIVGVRPKFKYKDQQLVTADLELNSDPELRKNPREFNQAMGRLLNELTGRGFAILEDPDPVLISAFGSMRIGTTEGVAYVLNFGKAVEGDEKAIEIGSSEPSKDETTESAEDNESDSSADGDPASDADTDAAESDADEETDSKNRYLMIRVLFDDSLLGDRPVKPIEPLKPAEPEGYLPPPAEEPAETEQEANEDADEEAEDAAPVPEERTDRDPAFVAYDEELKTYEQLMTEYNLNMTRYEDELKTFEAKVEKGKKRVAELNERFGDWYYVIAADNLNSLQSKRADVVKMKEPPENPDDDAAGVSTERPDISFEMPEIDLTAPPDEDANSQTEQKESPDPKDGSGEKPNTDTPTESADESSGEASDSESAKKKGDDG